MSTTAIQNEAAADYRSKANAEALQRRLWFLAVVALIVSQAVRPMTADSDYYAHAAVGRWIVEHRQVPQSTLFLWSAHEPWIAHSWLGELALYGIARTGETTGVAVALVIETAILVTVFAIPYFTRRFARARLLTAVAVTGLSVFAGASRFQVRPELFSDLAIVLLLQALIRWGRDLSSLSSASFFQRRVAPICILFALWANIHGGVIWGIGILQRL